MNPPNDTTALREDEAAATEAALGKRPADPTLAADYDRLAWAFIAGLRYGREKARKIESVADPYRRGVKA